MAQTQKVNENRSLISHANLATKHCDLKHDSSQISKKSEHAKVNMGAGYPKTDAAQTQKVYENRSSTSHANLATKHCDLKHHSRQISEEFRICKG